MLHLLLCSLAAALDGQSSIHLPGAEKTLGKLGRAGLGAAWTESEISPYFSGCYNLPRGLADLSYQHSSRFTASYRLPIQFKGIWAIAPFTTFVWEDHGTVGAGLSSQLHVSTVKIDFAIQLLSYDGDLGFPTDRLEAGFSFPPAPRQELRIGYAYMTQHELNLRYQHSGSWLFQDVQLFGGLEDWGARGVVGVRR